MRKGGYTGMRCKLHPLVPGSVGVCAYCLRERLLDLLAAQARDAGSGDDRRKSDPSPPPLIFPRSVSPTPTAGPSTTSTTSSSTARRRSDRPSPATGTSRRSTAGSLSSDLFSDLPPDLERWTEILGFLERGTNPRRRTPLLRGSLLFSLAAGRRSRGFSRSTMNSPAPDAGDPARPSIEGCHRRRRGKDTETETSLRSAANTRRNLLLGRRKPATPAHRKQGGGAQHSRNVSGFAFCLSPLVSHRHRPESGPSGEFRGANRHHLSSAASLSSNRSRKLVDFGRYP